MKIINLLKECFVSSPDMEEFKDIHPKQLISEVIPIPVWKIHYSYHTVRGNPKEANKYIIKDENAWDCIDNEFNHYIQEQNEKYPERKLSNVEILDASFMGNAELQLE